MDRTTKTFTTPFSNQKIEIKTYLTGREKRQITGVYLNNNLEVNKDTQNIKGISGDMIDKAQDLALEIIVVSIDDSKEDIINKILDMREVDFNAVVEEVDLITLNKDFTEKKTT